MVYEWDARRARRSHLAKMGFGLVAALVIVAVPALFAVSMVG